MAGKILKFQSKPRFFKNIKKGVIVRIRGEFEGKSFIVNQPIDVVSDLTAEDLRTFARYGIGTSRENMHQLFNETGVLNFKELADWLKNTDEDVINDVKNKLPSISDALSQLKSLLRNQDRMAVLQLISRVGLDLPAAIRAHDQFQRRARLRYPDVDTPVMAYLKNEPYVLAQVDGIEWQDADALAQQLGFPGEYDPKRIEGAVHAFLWKKTRDGHCFFPRFDTIYWVWLWIKGKDEEKLDKRKRKLIDNIISQMVDNKKLVFEFNPYKYLVYDLMMQEYPDVKAKTNSGRRGVLYLPAVYWSERKLAKMLADCALAKPNIEIDSSELVDAAREIAASEFGIELNKEQEQVIRDIANNTVVGLLGAAGTGKTTVENIILKAVHKVAPEIQIENPLAPTGRAAQLLRDTMGTQGSTIHRYLKLKLYDNDYIEDSGALEIGDTENSLFPKFITIDEAEMVTIILFRKLMEKIKPGTRILLAGDPNQLEAIGPGAILRELKNYNRNLTGIPVTTLKRTYRQGHNDPALENAWRILDSTPENPAEFLEVPGRFEVIREEKPSKIASKIQDKVRELVLQGVPFEDIMVLAAKYDGVAGATRLNQIIKEVVNPVWQRIPIQDTSFYLNDHVIATQNDYQDETDENRLRDTIYNGTRGVITEIKEVENEVLIGVRFTGSDKISYYRQYELDRYLDLAYALVVHKAIGGQADIVFMAGAPDSENMWDKSILYTGETRCKSGSKSGAVYLVGPYKLWQNASAKQPATRFSKFVWRLHDELGMEPNLREWIPEAEKKIAGASDFSNEYERIDPPSPPVPNGPGVHISDDFFD